MHNRVTNDVKVSGFLHAHVPPIQVLKINRVGLFGARALFGMPDGSTIWVREGDNLALTIDMMVKRP